MGGSDIFALLSSLSAVTALCATRIYPVNMPINATTFPLITYRTVGISVQQLLTGTGLRRVRLELNCWAQDYLTADTLRSALIESLSTFSGAAGNVTVLRANYIGQEDIESDEIELLRCMAEFYLFI